MAYFDHANVLYCSEAAALLVNGTMPRSGKEPVV